MTTPIACDPIAAQKTIDLIFGRYEALYCYLEEGLRNGIEAFDKVELGLGHLRATPDEVEKVLATVLARWLGQYRLEGFIDLLRIEGTDAFFEML